MYKKHKWFTGSRSFRAFIQLRQICDLTVCFEIFNLCQNANLAQCKLTGKSFEITYDFLYSTLAIIQRSKIESNF